MKILNIYEVAERETELFKIKSDMRWLCPRKDSELIEHLTVRANDILVELDDSYHSNVRFPLKLVAGGKS